MRRSKTENYEELEIVTFGMVEKVEETAVEHLTIPIPFNCGPFAQAAMLKGFREYFLKVTGEEKTLPEEMVSKIEHNLEIYERETKAALKKSLII